MTTKIALTGQMRSGKDTVGGYLMIRYKFQQFALSEGITKVCNVAGLIHPDTFRKPRAILQGVGQDLRKYDPEVWIKYTQRKIDARTMSGSGDNIVISDVRQENEVKAFRERGYFLVRVNADPDIRIMRMLERGETINYEELYHETEQHVQDFEVDYELNNNGTLPDLYEQIEEMMGVLSGSLY